MPQIIQIFSPSGIKWKGWAQNKLKALKRILAHPFNITYPLSDAIVQLISDGRNDTIRIFGKSNYWLILYAGDTTGDWGQKFGYLIAGNSLLEDKSITARIIDIGLYGITEFNDPDNPFSHSYAFNKEIGFIPYSPTAGIDSKNLPVLPSHHILHNTFESELFNYEQRQFIGYQPFTVLTSAQSLFYSLLTIDRPRSSLCIFTPDNILLSYPRYKIGFGRWIQNDSTYVIPYRDLFTINKYWITVSKDKTPEIKQTSPLTALPDANKYAPYKHLTYGITLDGGLLKCKMQRRLYYKYGNTELWRVTPEYFYKETLSSELSVIGNRTGDPNHWGYLYGHFGLRLTGWEEDSDIPSEDMWDNRSFIKYVANPVAIIPYTGFKDSFIYMKFRILNDRNSYEQGIFISGKESPVFQVKGDFIKIGNGYPYWEGHVKVMRERLRILHAVKDAFHDVIIFSITSLKNINNLAINEFKGTDDRVYESNNLELIELISEIKYYAYIDGLTVPITHSAFQDKKELTTHIREYLMPHTFTYQIKGQSSPSWTCWYFDTYGWSNLGYSYDNKSNPIEVNDSRIYPDRFFISTSLTGVLILYDIYRNSYANNLVLQVNRPYNYDYFTPYYGGTILPFTDRPEAVPLIDRNCLFFSSGSLVSIRLPDNLHNMRAINGISLIEVM